MELAILLFVSIGPMIYTWWRVCGIYAWESAEDEPKHRDPCYAQSNWEPSLDIWVGGFFVGFFAGIIWPILLVLKLVKVINGGKYVGHIPQKTRERLQAERIQQLEREVGIR